MKRVRVILVALCAAIVVISMVEYTSGQSYGVYGVLVGVILWGLILLTEPESDET